MRQDAERVHDMATGLISCSIVHAGFCTARSTKNVVDEDLTSWFTNVRIAKILNRRRQIGDDFRFGSARWRRRFLLVRCRRRCRRRNLLDVGMRIFPETLKRSETFRKFPKKRSETFRNFPIYRPSTRLLKLKNACIYDRSRKECTFTLCSYPDLFAHISRGMKYPALPASPGLMRHTSNIY